MAVAFLEQEALSAIGDGGNRIPPVSNSSDHSHEDSPQPHSSGPNLRRIVWKTLVATGVVVTSVGAAVASGAISR